MGESEDINREFVSAYGNIFTEDELASIQNDVDLEGKLFITTPYQVVGYCIEVETARGKAPLRYYTADVIELVHKYDGLIAELKDQKIMRRAVRMLMISYPLPELMTESEAAHLVAYGHIDPKVWQMSSWIGEPTLDLNEVEGFLKSIGGGGK